MNAGAIGGQLVLDGDLEGVAPVGHKGRTGILAVDSVDAARETIKSHGDVLNFQVVFNHLSSVGPHAVIVGGNTHAIAPALTGKGPIGALRVCLQRRSWRSVRRRA